MIPLILAGIAGFAGLSIASAMKQVQIEEQRNRAERLQNLLPVFRVVFGWKANDLGQKLDLSKQAISNIETGKTKLSVAQYLAIKYLFLDTLYNIGYLGEGKNTKQENKQATENDTDNTDNDLKLLFRLMFNALVDNPDDYSEDQVEGIKKRVIAIAKSKQINMDEEDVAAFYNALSKELVDENIQEYRQQQANQLADELEKISKSLRKIEEKNQSTDNQNDILKSEK